MKPGNENVSGGFPFQLDEFYLDLQEDGSKISMLSKEDIVKRPFPGLRPFKTSEFQLYNGRIGQAEELIKRLKKNRFLAVIGSSGTGKSSLVRAGLIPQLFGGYLHGAGSKWDIAICRPGKDPVENLAIALASIKTHTKEPFTLNEDFTSFESQLSGSIYGLLDAKESLDAGSSEKTPDNLLIIIDQFEELFRFDRKDLGKENIENHFVNLLLKAAVDPHHSIYVIITMRSEFLGDCVKYRGLPEAINEGQYLVPQLTRNELKEVIENPIRLAGKRISPSLVELLVNEIEESKLQDSLDQLPILQHALMRTYNEAMKDGPDTEISYEHYRRTGEMEKALANHAEAKFKELGEGNAGEKRLSKKQQLAKIIFQALTDAGTDQKGGRRPTELKNIYAIASTLKAGETEVNEVVNHFRDNDTSFIMPPINTILYPHLIIDISHESLMRNWARLNEWIIEELKLGNLYKLLNERRELHETDKEEWLRGMLLRELQEWKEKYPINATWAGRYNLLPKKINSPVLHENLYQRNLQFLQDSVSVNEKIKEEEKKELQDNIAREQKDKSIKKMIRVLSLAAVISFLFGIWAFAERTSSARQRKRAEENADSAQVQKTLAESNAREARINYDSATAQRKIAEDQRKKADSNLNKVNKLAKELKVFADERSRQAANAIRLQKSEKAQKENFKKQLLKNALKNEVFYFSTSLDQPAKEAIIDSLLHTTSIDTSQIQLAQYIDTALLHQINKVVVVKENIKEEPAKNLQAALDIWKTNKSPVIRNILLGIINDNIFSVNSVEVARSINLNTVSTDVSVDNTVFAFNNGNQVISGKTENGKLVLNENSFDDQFDRFFCGIKDSVSSKKNIACLHIDDGNQVVSVVDSFIIALGADGKVNSIRKVNGMAAASGASKYVFSRISPDGKLAIQADELGNVFLSNIPKTNGEVKMNKIGNYRNKILGNDNMFFSPNSQYLFINVDGKAKIINRNNKIIMISDWGDEYIDAAVYTPDSRSIVLVSEGKMSLCDTLLNKYPGLREMDLSNRFFTQSGISPPKIKSIQISKNLKRVLIQQEDERIFLLETRNADALFKKNKYDENNLRIKQIGNSKTNTRAFFYNDSAVISIADDGTVSLWNIYHDFENPGKAISVVLPQPGFRDKLQHDSLHFSDIIASSGTTELNIAADYYYKNGKIDYAKQIYQKLLNGSPVEMRNHYLNKLILLNVELNNIDRSNSRLDRSQVLPDTIKAYRQAKVNRLKENISFIKDQASTCNNKNKYVNDLSMAYGGLAFNQLFINDYDGAVVSAGEGLRLNPENDWIYTNLALGYLLTGRFLKAENIYKKNKDKWFSNKTQSFKSAFLGDFKDLEDAGIIGRQKQFGIDVGRIKKILE